MSEGNGRTPSHGIPAFAMDAEAKTGQSMLIPGQHKEHRPKPTDKKPMSLLAKLGIPGLGLGTALTLAIKFGGIGARQTQHDVELADHESRIRVVEKSEQGQDAQLDLIRAAQSQECNTAVKMQSTVNQIAAKLGVVVQ